MNIWSNIKKLIIRIRSMAYRFRSIENRFTRIYRKRYWKDSESASGPGSNLRNTEEIRKALPHIVKDLKIKSILDIPCGDYYWMKLLNLEVDYYIGADIVEDIINNNLLKFERQNIRFQKLDIRTNNLPKTDLILCRDLFVHFSFSDIQKSLYNLSKTGKAYLLMTNYSSVEKNVDIVTGKWRPINFQLSPFNFPAPILLINENDSQNPDKSLALWTI
ncbi:MAG: hypothetical protein CVU43_07145 [Chloroflexi bacterium HGW-Chloroflexi-5]|nr:MAG: hypothetical protein CVU43_07145 [Chloroflexi bacterium HGW-Chloroflexi-5]